MMPNPGSLAQTFVSKRDGSGIPDFTSGIQRTARPELHDGNTTAPFQINNRLSTLSFSLTETFITLTC
ncbi:hypothetical protein [Pedobacter miscanthi]|uniref:Uncharacterized protein n=1 Tax=Pedobacter miscanthi TaxID=2259170 RepID=A0A366L4F3_9SPHI|nr:hypothetical protein [Pedobacter miscanthi]RBQ08768.1 hypothetical protein DRW42_08665 [Pedobacter miscanthi]